VIVVEEIQDPFLRRIVALGKACLSIHLAEAYEDADARANRQRSRHRRITLVCVVPGTLALLLSIVQLALLSMAAVKPPGEDHLEWALLGLEIVLVALALAGVVLGYYFHQRDRWLYGRYRAERFRSSSFQVLIEPGFWGKSEPAEVDWHLALEDEQRNIRSLRSADEVAEHEEALTVPVPEVCASTVSELVHRLGNHYREQRIVPQIRYLERLIARRDGNWLDNPVVQPFVFFLSVGFVAMHLVFERAKDKHASILFMLFSAALPVAWTGFRTWRGANEHARNVSRSRAKVELLHAQSDGIEKELAAAKPDPFRVFTALAISENILRNELREWLRLMLDTEWYG
jgi:hypothetical protein